MLNLSLELGQAGIIKVKLELAGMQGLIIGIQIISTLEKFIQREGGCLPLFIFQVNQKRT